MRKRPRGGAAWPAWRRSRAAKMAGIGGSELVGGDVEKSACNVAHHLVEKAVAFKFKAEAAGLGDRV